MKTAILRRAWLPLIPLLAACGGGDGGPGEVSGDPVPGGTAIIAVLSDFQAFNPVVNTSILTDEVIKQMLFTPLIRYDEDLQPQPHLAERWELSDSAVVFHLRSDVRWHDGQPVTAEDVKFTFDLAKDPTTASLLGSAYMNQVASATVVDPQTIRFDFIAPHAQALDGFWWAPLPRHLLQDVAAGDLIQAPFNQQPVGSGPFRFVSWQRNQQLVLEANDSFPAGLGGRPHLDRAVFRVIPEPTTMITELMSGSADLIGYTLLPDQAVQLQNQSGVELRHFPSREFTYVGWNNERPLFNEPAVRQALAMSINRPELIRALMHGLAAPAAGMIPPWSPMYTEIEPLPYDPERARQLLGEAGWTDSNGDGMLDRGGQPFQFTLLVNSANRMHQDLATVIQQGLRELGIGVELRTVEFQTLLQQHKARDYDAVISNWTLDTFKVDPTPLFTCAEARTAGSANRAGFCDPAVDALIERGLRTTDAGAAKQTWAEFSRLLQERQPITFLFWSEDLAGVGMRVQGMVTDVRSKIANIDRWWIPESRRR
ncbi:MAG TPA: ABC transporter substrate-binding protein [Longimicrobiaceae bacterium]